MKKRQELGVSVTVTTEGASPREFLSNLLSAPGVEVHDTWEDSEVEDVPTVNVERLRKLAAWVAGEDAKRRLGLPSEWSQGHYFDRSGNFVTLPSGCGAACCVAGKVAVEDGGEPYWGYTGGGRWSAEVIFPDSDGQPVPVAVYARNALGLTDNQSDRLFDGNNGLDDVLGVIAELTGSELQD